MVADNGTATDRHAERVKLIYDAANVYREDQDEQTRSIIDWLAGWDDHTVTGVVKLLASTRVRAVLETQKAVADVLEAEEQRAARAHLDALRGGEQASVSAPDDTEGAQR